MAGFLAGEYDLDRAILDLQRDTRHYAKRQLTWFRADKTMNWVRPDEFRKILQMSTDFFRDTG
jgi:tRNA dimethylallyltransferase